MARRIKQRHTNFTVPQSKKKTHNTTEKKRKNSVLNGSIMEQS